MSIRYMRQSDMLRCLHYIIATEHYHDDGTCRCNDPSHTEMEEWGYVWVPTIHQYYAPGRWVVPENNNATD